ncbi:MAG TPA: dethiobiotin synthase [Solirubrobacteraceae bacterium]|nr:dethiobiotin synthase [Solirubrobacteraceae bacterium]
MRGLFVTGTDTDVGKTVLSASLLAAMRASGEPVVAYKPAVTGLDEPVERGEGQPPWPADHELLAAAAEMAPEDVAPLRYGPAVSPQLAAEMAGVPLTRERVLDGARAALARASSATADDVGNADDDVDRILIVEGAGGLLSPLAEEMTVCDLAVALRLPLLIAARPGLGTVNHTLLTVQAARAYGLDVRAVVLTPWQARPSRLEQSNRDAITHFGFVEVDTLARADGPRLAELERIGSELPWRRWLGASTTVVEPA